MVKVSSKSLWRSESGAAAVEFAITLPLLVLLFAGFMEFANLIYQQQQLEKSVRDAARYLSYYSNSNWNSSPGTLSCSTGSDPSTYLDAAENMVLYGSSCPSSSPIITGMTSVACSGSTSPWVCGQVTITSGSTSVTAPEGSTTGTSCTMTIPTVTVSVSTPYSDVIGLLSLLGMSNFTLTTSHEERVLANTAVESCT
jgi:Flp pilus assembly protein TadG